MNTAVRGIYRHYKGQYYEVLGVAHNSETEEAVVVYRALYGDFGLWVRPVSMFLSAARTPEGDVPRFVLHRAFD